MAQVFATRVFGANLKNWPLVTFGKKGYRDSLLKRSHPGDLICLVATNGSEVEKVSRGKLLAVCEFGREPIDAESALLEINGQRPLKSADMDEAGTFRWPFALPILRAWRFDPLRNIKEVIGRQLIPRP